MNNPTQIQVSVEESLRVTREIARLDGILLGVKLMLDREKAELFQKVREGAVREAASRCAAPAAPVDSNPGPSRPSE